MNIFLNSKINEPSGRTKRFFSFLLVSLILRVSSPIYYSQHNDLHAEENSTKIVSEKIASEFPDGIKFQAEFSSSKKLSFNTESLLNLRSVI